MKKKVEDKKRSIQDTPQGARAPSAVLPSRPGSTFEVRSLAITIFGFLLLAGAMDFITVLWIQKFGPKETQELLTLFVAVSSLVIGAVSFVRNRILPQATFAFLAGLFIFLGIYELFNYFTSALSDDALRFAPDGYLLWASSRIALVFIACGGLIAFLRKNSTVRDAWISVLVSGTLGLLVVLTIQEWGAALAAFRLGTIAHPIEAVFVAVFLVAFFQTHRRSRGTGNGHLTWYLLFFGFQAMGSAVMLLAAAEYSVGFFLALLLRLIAFSAIPIGLAVELLALFREREELSRKITEDDGKLRLLEQQLEGIIDALPMGLLLVSMPEFRAVMMNDWMKKFYGNEVSGGIDVKDFLRRFQIQHRDGRPYAMEEMTTVIAYREKRIVSSEDIIVLFPNGDRRFVRSVSSPILGADGAVRMVVLLLEDISSRVKAEQQLEDRENALLASYERAKMHEKEIVRLKDQFVFIAAHELRTPVNAIKWNVELLASEKGSRAKLGKGITERIEDIGAASAQLLLLVEDLLNVARLDYGTFKVVPEPMNVLEAVNAAIRTVTPLAKRQGMTIRVEGKEAVAYADPRRVSEVVLNLLTNGIKYNRPHGTVTVRVFAEGARAAISVSDTGIGIAPEDVPKLFQKFSRIQTAETRDVEGTGLGLFIVQEIVEKMGGQVSVQSAKGVGSTFTVRLPATKT